ncbi:MAG: YfiR family protein [Alphaproteobacteria bacterium]|nr:YfiR family protein [Alphaproteobacteria bacterium]
MAVLAAHRRTLACLFLMALLCSSAPLWAADTALEREYKIKAVFLYNFTHFVEWPATRTPPAEATAERPAIICVYGKNPFGASLDYIHEKQGAALEVRYPKSANEAAACHLLFIAASAQGQMPSLLASLKGRGVLTVSDIADFAHHGGMVGMNTHDNKVKLEINAQTFAQEGFRSAQLLELAEIVP